MREKLCKQEIPLIKGSGGVNSSAFFAAFNDKFAEMLQREPSLGYVYRLAKESGRMLEATLHGDVVTKAEILEKAHNTEIPLLSYNNETDLTAVVNFVYLTARDRYRVEREDKAGIGYVDFIFYPEIDKSADAIILELKVNHTPEEAIRQIKEKKMHCCKVEVLE